MKRLIELTFGLLLVIGCSSHSKRESVLEEHRQRNSRKNDITKILAEEQGIEYDWDTLEFDFSIQAEKVIQSEKQLISYPLIKDILKSGNQYEVVVESISYPTYYFTLTTKDEMLIDQLLEKATDDIFFSDWVFVAKIDSLKKLSFETDVSIESLETATLDVMSSEAFFGKGRLIDVKTF